MANLRRTRSSECMACFTQWTKLQLVHFELLRSSVDLQCIANPYAVAAYIIGYVTKHETENFNEAFHRAVRETGRRLPNQGAFIFIQSSSRPYCLPLRTSQCTNSAFCFPFTLIVKELRKSTAEGLTSACGVPLSFFVRKRQTENGTPRKYTKKRRKRQSKWQNLPRHLPTLVSASQAFFFVSFAGSFFFPDQRVCPML